MSLSSLSGPLFVICLKLLCIRPTFSTSLKHPWIFMNLKFDVSMSYHSFENWWDFFFQMQPPKLHGTIQKALWQTAEHFLWPFCKCQGALEQQPPVGWPVWPPTCHCHLLWPLNLPNYLKDQRPSPPLVFTVDPVRNEKPWSTSSFMEVVCVMTLFIYAGHSAE